jgi:hypothetical protein
MNEDLKNRIEKVVIAIKSAEYILIGGGAGFSDAAIDESIIYRSTFSCDFYN